MTRAPALLRRVRRAVLARRRWLAALCLGGAVALGLSSRTAPPPPTVPVVVAAHDLAGGGTLSDSDLTVRRFAPGTVPDGAVRRADAVGAGTVGPVRAGEPITDARLLGAGLLEQHPGTVAAPVRIGDAGALRLVRVGDRVDIWAADPQQRGDAELVVARVPVLAVPPPGRSDPGLTSGGLLVVAVPGSSAQRLAEHGVGSFLSLVLVR